ncbi:hypothetical protein AURANDRAFT_61626 [Aureococcus anophagefferens]|uniref:Aspartyl/asparaginy/proline hydroxylase domain-containing protein n=1 Tax=Aureococcus anophagefferens TaxID=44056 RepID=F0Y0S6_AURAN|nr:hypothetical protein AURANDRAFT_61626 [Aureococcus anophagefferens]EGB11267.1 hypothetical protein AURANDRAFT_61626 [Aureococcus anophagefferens]|eukprot:XP_009033652.1 hypothetical protein AURANDRAFT_61626 [Aureococcus anophagefferens]
MVGMKVDLQHEGEDGCRRVTLNEKWQKKRCGLLFKVAGLASEDELILSRQGSSKVLDLAAPIGEALRDGETYVVRQRSVAAARSAMALPAAPSGAHPPAAVAAEAAAAKDAEAAARKKEEEARALAAKKRARDAERAAQAKAGAAPPSSAALNREAAAGLRESGNEKFRAGDLEAAEQFYKVAIKAAPGDARSRANLAAIALKQGRFVDAARYAAAALERQEREPNVGKWWFRLGRGQHGMKRFADALNSFHSGLQAADATPGSQLRNDLAKAMETAEKALRQQWAKVAELSGRAAKEEGNRSTYRWLTESLLDCDPTNVYALQQLGALALEECVGPVGRRDAKFAGLAPPEDDAAGERSDDEAPEVGAGDDPAFAVELLRFVKKGAAHKEVRRAYPDAMLRSMRRKRLRRVRLALELGLRALLADLAARREPELREPAVASLGNMPLPEDESTLNEVRAGLHLALGNCHRALGAPAHAVARHFTNACEAGTKNVVAWSSLSQTLLDMGDRRSAAACHAGAVERGVWEHPAQRPCGFARGLGRGLKGGGFWDPARAPDLLRALRGARAEILAEASALMRGHAALRRGAAGDLGGVPRARVAGEDIDKVFRPYASKALEAGGEWGDFGLRFNGMTNTRNCAACPVTANAIASCEAAHTAVMGSAYFSLLQPKTHLKAHCGPTNLRLRMHFGLFVPKGCRIRVHDETRAWKEGECLLFDDSFEHEVWNDSDEPRLVLIIDVWHPDLKTDRQRLKHLDAAQKTKYKMLKMGHVEDTEESGH